MNEKRLHAYAEALDQVVAALRTDKEGKILHANEKLCALAGYAKEELEGQSPDLFRHPDTPASTFEGLWKTIGMGQTWRGVLKNRDKEGAVFYARVTILPLPNDAGDPDGYLGLYQPATAKDRTPEEVELEKLERQAIRDPLTGCFTRRKMEAFLEEAVETGERYGTPFALIFIQINGLDALREEYGDYLANETVKTTVGIADSNFRKLDKAARWSDGRLAVYCPQTLLGQAAGAAERFRSRMEETPSPIKEKRIDCSIGVVQFQGGETLLELVRRAEERMEFSEKSGSNRVCF